jgi:hypothetical protein
MSDNPGARDRDAPLEAFAADRRTWKPVPPACNQDARLENLAAKLTSAVYPIALRHGVGGSWLDMELGLWRALAAAVKKWG